MKKIVFVLISVIIFFSSCNVNTDPIEKYSGINFGMTKNEVENILGIPDSIDYEFGTSYEYTNQKWFGLSGESLTCYDFNDNDVFFSIMIFYKMDNLEQYKKAYSSVKNEISNYYQNTQVNEDNGICSFSSDEFFAMVSYTKIESANYGLCIHLCQKTLVTEQNAKTSE